MLPKLEIPTAKELTTAVGIVKAIRLLGVAAIAFGTAFTAWAYLTSLFVIVVLAAGAGTFYGWLFLMSVLEAEVQDGVHKSER